MAPARLPPPGPAAAWVLTGWTLLVAPYEDFEAALRPALQRLLAG